MIKRYLTIFNTSFRISSHRHLRIVLGMCSTKIQLIKEKFKELSMSQYPPTNQTESMNNNWTYGNQIYHPNTFWCYPIHMWLNNNYSANANSYIFPTLLSNCDSFSYVPHLVTPYFTNRQIQNSNPYGYRNRRCKVQSHKKTNGEKVMSLRLWENISPHSKIPGFIFTLMSYNVLAQDLLEKHPYLYKGHNPKALSWDTRWNNLLTEIRKFNPDIICFQEVQESHIEQYYSILESFNYGSIFKRRTGIRTDGCAIYYKKDNIELIDYLSVEFLRPEVPLLNRDNVGLIAKFVPKRHSSREFVVATTHLLYNPRRNDVRLSQMQLFLSEISKLSQTKQGEPSHVPVIITGDLNTQPSTELYKLIATGNIICNNFFKCSFRQNDNNVQMINKDNTIVHKDVFNENPMTKKESLNLNTDSLTENFCFRSVYDHGVGKSDEGTTFQGEWMTVDYIFYSVRKDINKSDDKLKLLSRWRLPTKEELNGTFIPNTVFGSDHFSLIAKFKLEF